MLEHILFITDGSESARAAGAKTLEFSLLWDVPVQAIFILDEGWGSLLGDEWINTSDTRMKFFRYFEGNLRQRAEEILAGFIKQAEERGIKATTAIKVGKTEKVIAEAANAPGNILLVLPNPHATEPAAAAGLKFNLQSLTKKINCPVYIGTPE